jgi:hypothetical protein
VSDAITCPHCLAPLHNPGHRGRSSLDTGVRWDVRDSWALAPVEPGAVRGISPLVAADGDRL